MRKPENRPWRVLSSEYVARRPWFTVRRESVELPTGAVVPEWYVFEFPDWVNVIARTAAGEFVMISQYRHALGETHYELVAGTCEQGETAEQSARRELLEETGYVSEHWQYLGSTIDSSAKLTNYMHLFLATNCRHVAGQHLDATEILTVEAVPLKKAVDMVMTNEICCNSSANGILRAARLLGK